MKGSSLKRLSLPISGLWGKVREFRINRKGRVAVSFCEGFVGVKIINLHFRMVSILGVSG